MTLSEFKETKFFKIIKNKYLITIMVFLVLILFSPEHNVIYYFKLKKQLTELEGRRDDLKEKIKSDSIRMSEIQKDLKSAEKFGREKYMMKKADEDIYVIKEKEKKLDEDFGN